ncbi:uncharacterized protein LOC112041543 [Lingula anatina]|uniref:Uncharacterized protein LOC112041543 n=1 Tax=Lingula anatina TaxID=7574 RepID=A0A2R2MKC9_LINAN|nr:uncharacterized protein LOC112041543 [Lingula anatina]|eukprot:XP_023930658.1 uncharacterized protein LOC112041543 [Lingula anatina]
MGKSDPPHGLTLTLSCTDNKIVNSQCSYVAGMSGDCSHIYGLVHTLAHYQQYGLKEVPAELSATSLPQQWHKPRGKKISPAPVMEMVMSKAKSATDRKRKPVYTAILQEK